MYTADQKSSGTATRGIRLLPITDRERESSLGSSSAPVIIRKTGTENRLKESSRFARCQAAPRAWPPAASSSRYRALPWIRITPSMASSRIRSK